MEVKLLNNGGKSWEKFGESYIKGFAFIGEDLLEASELYCQFVDSIKKGFLASLLLKLNGNFSAIINNNGTTYLIADKLKSYPLLYMQQLGDWIVTDQSKIILEYGKRLELNENAILTYLACGYLHDEMTFVEGCHIVMAGSYVKINDKAEIYQYHRHIYSESKIDRTEEEIIQEAVDVMDQAFLRMMKSVGNRPIFIPLSGGYDSRLLACLCKKFNISNVSCFTYGDKVSYDVEISKQVARQLGFSWYFVEYTNELKMELLESEEFVDYKFFAMNLNTSGHTQDFIAFKELRRKGIIPDDAVIIPGHTGDVFSRHQIPYWLLKTNKSIARLLYEQFYDWNVLKKTCIKQVIEDIGIDLCQTISSHDTNLACDLFTNWNIQNRQANFIVNAVRVYEYYGVDWRIPLWDDKLSSYWLSVKCSPKYYQILYNKYMFDGYFIPLGVAIYKKRNTAMKFFTRLKLPCGIKDEVKYRLCSHFRLLKKYYDPNSNYLKVDFLKNKLNTRDIKCLVRLKNNGDALLALYQVYLLQKRLNK